MIFSLNENEKNKILKHYNTYKIQHNNAYAEEVFEYNNLKITVFKNKVMFQGPISEIIEEYRKYWYIFDLKQGNVIGNDEVGTGDYFGPIVITSTYITQAMLEKLRQLPIRDSKLISNEQIYLLANKIMKIVTFESVVINNRRYNQWISQGFNANVIKAWGHNQVLVKMLQHKIFYNEIVIDQFVNENKYYSYLENENINKNKIIKEKVVFTIKAESKYLAVACSAIISRYLFLEEIKKISLELKDNVPLGAGEIVDNFTIQHNKKTIKDLDKFLLKNAKYHFANTKKIFEKIKNN